MDIRPGEEVGSLDAPVFDEDDYDYTLQEGISREAPGRPFFAEVTFREVKGLAEPGDRVRLGGAEATLESFRVMTYNEDEALIALEGTIDGEWEEDDLPSACSSGRYMNEEYGGNHRGEKYQEDIIVCEEIRGDEIELL